MEDRLDPEETTSIGASLRRLGRLGLTIQVVVGAAPILGLVAYVAGAVPALGRFQLIHGVALASFSLLLAGIVWFWLYTREGARLARPGETASRARLMRRVWIGLVINAGSITLSMIVLLVEVGYVLYRFLEAPQGGLPVFVADPDGGFISALDMLSLVALHLVVAAQVIVLLIGLALFHRVATPAARA